MNNNSKYPTLAAVRMRNPAAFDSAITKAVTKAFKDTAKKLGVKVLAEAFQPQHKL